MKKIFFLLVALSSYITTFATKTPEINCSGLPGCTAGGGIDSSVSGAGAFAFLGILVSEIIKYVAVLAVIALMFAGIMYILSGGEDEKTKKAKNWIIYSLIGVFISVSAYFIINLINETQFNI